MGTGTKQSQIKAFKTLVGQQVTVKWSMGGFPDVLDAIGGDPQLLVNGAINTSVLNKAKCKRRRDRRLQQPPDRDRRQQGVRQPRAATARSGSSSSTDARAPAGPRGCACSTTRRRVALVQQRRRSGLAHFMQNLGAYDAINLDGGGSTGMWIKKTALTAAGISTQPGLPDGVRARRTRPIGCFVNRPTTDGTHIAERSAQSAVMVLNGPDTNEPL